MKPLSALYAILVAAVIHVPAIAEACPTCAKRDGADIYYNLDLLAMMALPFAVAGVVFTLVRRVSKEEEAGE